MKNFVAALLLTAAPVIANAQALNAQGDIDISVNNDGTNVAAAIGADSAAFAGTFSGCGMNFAGDLDVSINNDGTNVAVAYGDRSHAAAGSALIGDDSCY